jgi:hypothetical protein
LRKTIIGLAVLAVLVGGLYFSGFAEGFVSGFEGHPGLPGCNSSHGRSDAQRAIDNSPWAKSSGIAVVAISDTKALSANGQKVECSATVILNSAQKGMLTYSFAVVPSLGNGQYYINASIDADSLTPYP